MTSRTSTMMRMATGSKYRWNVDPAGQILPTLQGVGVEAPGWQYVPDGHSKVSWPFFSGGQYQPAWHIIGSKGPMAMLMPSSSQTLPPSRDVWHSVIGGQYCGSELTVLLAPVESELNQFQIHYRKDMCMLLTQKPLGAPSLHPIRDFLDLQWYRTSSPARRRIDRFLILLHLLRCPVVRR